MSSSEAVVVLHWLFPASSEITFLKTRSIPEIQFLKTNINKMIAFTVRSDYNPCIISTGVRSYSHEDLS